jgi:hypothetical protein
VIGHQLAKLRFLFVRVLQQRQQQPGRRRDEHDRQEQRLAT